MGRTAHAYPVQSGYTLIELIMVIVVISILAVTAAIKWPPNMEEEAAVLEFKHAYRYAQHLAMTRDYLGPASAWGLFIAGNQYTIQRNGDPTTAVPGYSGRTLLDKPINLTGPDVLFNGLGEPITAAGTLLAAGDPRTYTIESTRTLTFCSVTGAILEGGSCP